MEQGKVKIVIVEDEFVIAEDIRITLQDHGYDMMAIFDRGEAALPFIIKENPDMVLVDIHLDGEMDGVELVKQLRAKANLPVVYLTANSDATTYERARDTHPNAFLIKPFASANLLASVDLALFNFSEGTIVEKINKNLSSHLTEQELVINQSLFVKINGRFKKIHGDEILFIEASGSYLNIQTSGERYTLSQNLAHFQKKTPLANLVRIHRSYIINVDKVEFFEESFVFIRNHKLPLSDNFKAEFLARIHCL